MTKLEQILLGRSINWVYLDYDLEDGRTFNVYHFSGTIAKVGDEGVAIRMADNTYKFLGLYDVKEALDKEPDFMDIWYAIARHQGALRRAEKLADRTPHDIYTLTDPRDNIIRYVGMSKQVGLRYDQHIHFSGTNEYKNAWMRNLLEHGLLPELGILEHIEGRYYARRREDYWINHFLQLGLPLTNVGDWTGINERILS